MKIYFLTFFSLLLALCAAISGCNRCSCCGVVVDVNITCIKNGDTIITGINYYNSNLQENYLQQAADTINFYQARGFTCTETPEAANPSEYCGVGGRKGAEASGMLCGDNSVSGAECMH
jgi:hypothetical protein